MRCIMSTAAALTAAMGFAASAAARNRVGDTAPDFPPGLFSDGKVYSMSEFRGKPVVVYFYEEN